MEGSALSPRPNARMQGRNVASEWPTMVSPADCRMHVTLDAENRLSRAERAWAAAVRGGGGAGAARVAHPASSVRQGYGGDRLAGVLGHAAREAARPPGQQPSYWRSPVAYHARKGHCAV
jgi:hypothetical protein